MFCCIARKPRHTRTPTTELWKKKSIEGKEKHATEIASTYNQTPVENREIQKISLEAPEINKSFEKEKSNMRELEQFGNESITKALDTDQIVGIDEQEGNCETQQNLLSLTEEDYFEKQQNKKLEEEISKHIEEKTCHLVKISLQNPDLFKKQISSTEIEDDSIKADLDFHELTLNDYFSFTLIKKEFTRAEKIFQRMNPQEKNKVDSQGFCPAHLVVLIYISGEDNLFLMKKIIYHEDVVVNKRKQNFCKLLQEALAYKSIPAITHILRASEQKARNNLNSALKKFVHHLEELPDFSLSISVKVSSFIPLLEKITPNDVITFYKKGSQLRIDYSLVGYSYLQCKRRRMSFFVTTQQEQIALYALNHDQKTMTDLLEPLTREQIIKMIQDLLSSDILSEQPPQILNLNIRQQQTFFNEKKKETVSGINSFKHQLSLTYKSKARKKKIQNKNPKIELQFLKDWSSYLSHMFHKGKRKQEKKKLNMEVWLAQEYKLSLSSIVKILDVFSIGNEGAEIMRNFFHHEKVRDQFNYFPIKVHIPINFSLYLDVQFGNVKPLPEETIFNFLQHYRYRPRSDDQKPLQRRQKRLTLAKLYL